MIMSITKIIGGIVLFLVAIIIREYFVSNGRYK